MNFYNFIFSNKAAVRIFRHTCFWIARYIYGVTIFLYYNSNIQSNFWLTLKVRCIKWLVVMPFDMVQCYLIIYWLVPYFLLRKKYFIFFGSVVFVIASGILLVDRITLNQFTFEGIRSTTVSALVRGTPVTCLVFFVIKMLKTWYAKEQEKELLTKENLNAELQLLKAQVHPHFLFNTLNNIYAFILSNPPTAKNLVKKLEKLLRYMITECDQPLVQLMKEINLIHDYISLEKVRYGNNLLIEANITGDENKLITPLLMIPFVENSFKHGTSKMLTNPWIKLSIEIKENILYFSVANSKPDSDESANNKKGIGLTNVKKRLQLLYPGNHSLEIESTNDTFIVNMHLPLHEALFNKDEITTNKLISIPV